MNEVRFSVWTMRVQNSIVFPYIMGHKHESINHILTRTINRKSKRWIHPEWKQTSLHVLWNSFWFSGQHGLEIERSSNSIIIHLAGWLHGDAFIRCNGWSCIWCTYCISIWNALYSRTAWCGMLHAACSLCNFCIGHARLKPSSMFNASNIIIKLSD